MISLLILIIQVNIKEKIENAPDSGYEIGVLIGTYWWENNIKLVKSF